ncbi:ATP-dependent DNA helicase [Nocardia donostiensis]|uniref:ATP-dependent helicase n=1 Tax=Nocardia donostiensis TaxID=1538463 RepID=UPI0009DB38E8|nr:ATP-dependent DNA helicase [Nocardia donostiensis]OQS13904.1 ATP-dependent DNA helicase [Nocardia donostiensis]
MNAPVTPWQLAEALGLPPPTDEQAAVIAAPPGPTLVVAGAGAGKTETMAARVVWMVANRLVSPEEVLGLTFTRKAAQQLTTRIRTRLARLAGAPLLRDLDPSGELHASLAGAEPEISTYHSYAGRLLSEHGLLLPVEPSAMLLTETQLWQLAHQVVRAWDGDLDIDRSPVAVTEAVLALSGQLAEHLVEPEQLTQANTELDKLVHTLPPGPRQRGGPSADLRKILRVQRERVELLPLVQRLSEALRRRGALDFGAQMSLAARLAAEHPEVAAAERARFRLVLLDEYQDTGHAQRILLAGLFGGSGPARREQRLAVTAVGDPMQSIYGWRGASAANLPRFATDFPSAPGVPAPTLPLLTSWRNPPEALALANMVAEPLRRKASDGGGVTVDALRAKPGAEPGVVALALTETVAGEREWIAQRIAAEWSARHAAGRPPPTSAVLVRRNADAPALAEALREQGLPVEIVGLGGLLATPEVADIVATLRLVAEPAAGSAAVRVLTGARWRLGVADLAALARRARELSIGREAGAAGDIRDGATLAAALREVAPEPAEQAGLADAIADPGPSEHYSEAGYQRIVALGRELAALRERSGQPLTELVADIERTIGVGVETQARRAMSGTGAGREHLDAFAEVVAGYAADTGASLGGLLAFLAAAESVENGLEPGEVDVAEDRVQVLTVHAAKGLEWEVVAVPHVVRGVFPSGRNTGTWLGALAELPTALRGDRAEGDVADGVPVLDLSQVYDRADLERCISEHKAALERRRLDEDRRLFYVALTRTERVLLVSAHHWAETGNSPKGPSDFLLELHRAAAVPGAGVEIAHWAEPPEAEVTNPFAGNPPAAYWPRDPLGVRRGPIEQGAALVRAAMTELAEQPDGDTSVDPDDPDGWAADVDALLAEYLATRATAEEVELPGSLPATALVELRADPAKLAARLRRPLPYPPNPLARRGTAFHAWVQRWFSTDRLPGLDELPGAADTAGAVSNADAELARMQNAFLSSPWAGRSPIEVEVPFETTIAGTVVRGRMDAVFAEPGGRWIVVDWKTGAEPGPAEEPAVAIQLAVYRLAWARLMAARTGATEQQMLQRVGAAFHYVRGNRTVAPAELPGPAELAELIRNAAPDGSPTTHA